MKSTINFALVALAAAVSGAVFTPAAQAQSGEQLSSPDYSLVTSSRSRAEVHAEAVAANRARSGWSNYQATIPTTRFTSTKTRQQVAAETLEAIRLGQVSHSGEYQPTSVAARPDPAAVARTLAARRDAPRQ